MMRLQCPPGAALHSGGQNDMLELIMSEKQMLRNVVWTIPAGAAGEIRKGRLIRNNLEVSGYYHSLVIIFLLTENTHEAGRN